MEIYLSQDAKEWTKVADSELEQKAGDYLFDVPKDKDGKMMVAQYVKFNIVSTWMEEKTNRNIDCKLWRIWGACFKSLCFWRNVFIKKRVFTEIKLFVHMFQLVYNNN